MNISDLVTIKSLQVFLLCWINTFPSVSIHGLYIRKKKKHTEIQFALLRYLDHNQRCIQTVGHPNYTNTGIEKPHRHTHKNKYTEQIHFYVGGRGQGCGSPGEKGAGGVRETGEERAASAREIQKCKLWLFVTAYIQSKKPTQQRFSTSIYRSPRLKAKFHRREKSKNENS